MDTVPCPGCAASLPLDQEVCGRCRRPRDEREIELGYEAVRERERRRRRRPKIAAALLCAAVGALGLYLQRHVFFRQVAAWREEFEREMEAVSNPTRASKPLSPAAERIMAVIAPGERSGATPASAPTAQPSAPAEPPPRVAQRPPEPPVYASMRVVYGVVYDMASVFPVANAAVSFERSGRTIFQTFANEQGHYVISLSRADTDAGLNVTVRAAGYRPGQLEDGDPPYRERAAKQRREAVAQIIDSDLEAVPLRYPPSADVVPLDFVLIRR
ncbi:MAG: hypothetical protein HYZ74_02875 [Elusimicrobia bacterium]|nr:hypothetical protein [Elusimicrobiota bacterium]